MYVYSRLFQLTLSDQSWKLKDIFKEATTSSIWCPNIPFVQLACYRISSLDGRGIADFDELLIKKNPQNPVVLSYGFILWSDNVTWSSCTFNWPCGKSNLGTIPSFSIAWFYKQVCKCDQNLFRSRYPTSWFLGFLSLGFDIRHTDSILSVTEQQLPNTEQIQGFKSFRHLNWHDLITRPLLCPLRSQSSCNISSEIIDCNMLFAIVSHLNRH